jgi:hypothetical protein
MPEVPSLQEQGVPDFDIASWYGIAAPAALPSAIRERLGAEVVAALNAWSAAHESARAGARAELVGVPARDAARRALVGAQARDLHIASTTGADGTHRVRVRSTIPRLLPWLPVPTASSQAEARP